MNLVSEKSKAIAEKYFPNESDTVIAQPKIIVNICRSSFQKNRNQKDTNVFA